MCSFVKNFTPKFKTTGRAILFTILIDRPAVYLTRASGLKTYSQTVHNFNLLHPRKLEAMIQNFQSSLLY